MPSHAQEKTPSATAVAIAAPGAFAHRECGPHAASVHNAISMTGLLNSWPMALKEIRQGVRGRTFVLALLLLQAILIFVFMGHLADRSDHGQITESSHGFFWFSVGLPLLVLLPLGALNAVASETKAKTLELVQLTRLSALAVVSGKWAAIIVQMLLIASTLLPFFLLRYFLGGVDVLSDLAVLGWILFAAAVAAAAAVVLSTLPSRAMRGIVAGLVFFALFGGSNALLFAIMRVSGSGSSPLGSIEFAVEAQAATIATGILGTLLLLRLGAARISAPAENLSTSLRLLGLAINIPWALLVLSDNRAGWALAAAAMLVTAAVATAALCETVRPLPSICAPFVRAGFAGRLFGAFFYPGWVSAIGYTVCVVVLSAFVWARMFDLNAADPASWVVFSAAVATLFFCVAVGRFAERSRGGKAVIIGFAVAGLGLLLASFVSVAAAIGDSKEINLVLSWLPPAALLQGLTGGVPDGLEDLYLMLMIAVGALSFLALALMAAREWQRIRVAETKAAQMLAGTNAA